MKVETRREFYLTGLGAAANCIIRGKGGKKETNENSGEKEER